MISLEAAKEHLGIDEDDTQDDHKVSVLVDVAVCAVQNYINRKLYLNEEELSASEDSTGKVLNEDISHAIKLFMTHFYENPSLSSDMTIKKVPGIEYLLDAHRIYNV